MGIRGARDDRRERLMAEKDTERFVAPDVLRVEAVQAQRCRQEDEGQQRQRFNSACSIHAFSIVLQATFKWMAAPPASGRLHIGARGLVVFKRRVEPL
jgi:hypothetical protein